MPFEVEVTNVATGATVSAVIEEAKPCQACEGTGLDGGEIEHFSCEACLACGGTGAELPEES